MPVWQTIKDNTNTKPSTEELKQMHPVIDFISKYTRVSPDELNTIAGMIHYTSFRKNEMMMQQGDISKHAAFILKGAVRSYYIDDNGTEHTIAFTFENEPLVAMDSFFQQLPSSSSTATMEATDIIYITQAEFYSFLEKYPKYESVIRTILSEYMTLAGVHSKLLRISSSRERYEALCKLQPEVVKRVPQKYVASYLGMALETLSRIRSGKL